MIKGDLLLRQCLVLSLFPSKKKEEEKKEKGQYERDSFNCLIYVAWRKFMRNFSKI